MTDWTPVVVLPNVALEDPIEGDLAALVSTDDDRITTLKGAHPNFRSFLGKFTDAFGVRLRPTVLILRGDAPQSIYTVGAVAGFRDLIALSVIPYNRALELKCPRGHRILFASAFFFYPWMLDKDFDHIVVQTPAILGLHKVTKFKGQSSSEVFPMTLGSSAIDAPLLEELRQRWRRRYTIQAPAWSDVALFRSLNMAHQASLLPAAGDTTFYDIGRSIALWVSAFEILVHPGGNGQANLIKVLHLLETVPWHLRLSRHRRFKTQSKKVRPRGTLASWIYRKLYTARNDFLHGNPVSRKDLIFKGANRNLFEYAGPLYRLALTAFLPLTFTEPIPAKETSTELGEYLADQINFLDYQRTFEECLFTARRKPSH